LLSTSTCFRKADAKVGKDFIPSKHFHNKFDKKINYFTKPKTMASQLKNYLIHFFFEFFPTFLFSWQTVLQKREI